MPYSYNDLYLETRRLLRNRGIDAYSLEARILTAYAAGKTPEAFLRDIYLYATDAVETKLAALIERRLRGEPVAYITNSWDFYGLRFTVTPDVLIPRTDTEVLVDTSIAELKDRPEARILDLCAGSGCIGSAIAANVPEAHVVMADNSVKALEICRENVYLNGLESRVSFMMWDVFTPPPVLLGSFDLVVCNPPYIKSAELRALDVSVRDYEPVTALDGGDDGLAFYRAILGHRSGICRPNAVLCFEVGAGQSEDVRELMTVAGFRDVDGVFDSGGIERVVRGVVAPD